MTNVFQNQPFNLVFLMKDSLGTRVTGLLASAVNVNISTPGSNSFSQVPSSDFIEIGFGYYSISVAQANTANLGEILAVVSAAGAVDFDKTYSVVPSPAIAMGASTLCTVSGNIVDIGGTPVRGNTPITVRGNNAPITLGGSFLSSSKIVTNTDADGNFSVKLLRNQPVTFKIEGAGIKEVAVIVPDQPTANLSDLIPV